MCLAQHEAGRKFVLEHPASASSWNFVSLRRLAEISGIYSFDSDLLKIYTSSETIGELIDKRCRVDRELVLYDAFIYGMLVEEIHGKREVRFDLMSVADVCDPVEEKQIVESMMGIDDVSGEPPDPSLMRKARQEEMRDFGEGQENHHVLRSVAQADPEGKFIGVRWVDVNKGTKEVPKVRSRLVGQEFAHGERRDDLYAPTPPQAAARFLLSTCAGQGKRGPGQKSILLLDIKKAFPYGKISRNVYIERPVEDPMSEGGGWWHLVGKLDKAMYGTRDAPAEWQAELERAMIKLGFRPVVSTPCLYCHSLLDVRVVGHVDDLICVGPRIGLDTFF